MPENWKTYKLSEVAAISNGKSKPNETGEVPIYGGNGILGYTNQFNSVDTIIIIGRVGAYCGSVYFENRPIWLSDNAMKAVCLEGFDSKFLFYLLKKTNLNQFAGGSSQPLLTQSTLNEVNLNFPEIEEQKAIASILSALDDKIELNLQQNKTLEEMAMTLYKHWFVDFGPFQDSEFVESELGMIPKDWEVKNLSEISTELRRGVSPKYIEEKGVRVINQKCIRNHLIDFSLTRRHDSISKSVEGRLLRVGDVLVNSTGVGTLGRLAPILSLDEDTVVDSHVTVVRCDLEKLRLYTFGRLMISIEKIVESLGEGSTGQTELSRIALGEIKVIVAPLTIQDKIEDQLQRFANKVDANILENQALTTLRDTLLPKLISGEIRVKDAEKLIHESI
ncbi:MAG: restriction endonuclease subunit [Fluviicola sp.]|jgi:type I restriction enzyme S subunit|uniref:restriction endonuclease subunit S n=1 Tax=Fluviicola sp. TaxID=1917219 RepID=UPI00262DD55C|nr:restriction endonuclease subunit S [Fluviicola sp.]MDF3027037.1 restriction endonuclease subunit [Fluviicola sp.]